VLATYQVTIDAVNRARNGGGTSLIEAMTYRRKGHAEHDNQSYVPAGEIDHWARENDPVDRYVQHLTGTEGVGLDELAAIDARVTTEIDEATDHAEASPPPEPRDGLIGVYAEPGEMPVLWYREGIRSAVDSHERPASWGTHDG
jgi:TPP-dependent pyruvate/acetoin dehydrogenase alpha subunit